MTVKILGLDEIQRKLDSLPEKMQKNVLASGNRAVANQVKKRAQAATTNETMRKGLKVIQAHFNGTRVGNKWRFLVGVRKPFSSLTHLFEFGTAERFTEGGARRGRMSPKPFLRPAVESMSAQEAEAIFSKAAGRNFDRQLAKLK